MALPLRLRVLPPAHRATLSRFLASDWLQRRARVRFHSNSAPLYQPPTPPNGDNPHRAFYRSWSTSFAKNFLTALFTYQIIYWSWLKLESLETKQESEEQIKSLEGKLAELTK